jgi:hypothetical protein
MATVDDYERLIRLKGYDGVSDAQLLDAINEGRRRLVRDHRWVWLEANSSSLVTVANVATVALSGLTTVAHVDAVRLVQAGVERNLSHLPLQELRDRQSDEANVPGVPRYWTRRNAQLLLYPTPNAVYTLVADYVLQPAPLVSGTDAVVPDDFQDLVAWASVPSLAFRQREAWAMQYADKAYTDLRRVAIAQDDVQQRQRAQQVRPYWRS